MSAPRFSLASIRVARALLVAVVLSALAGSEAQGLFVPCGGVSGTARVESTRWALHVLMAPDEGAPHLPDLEDVSPDGDWDDDQQLPAEESPPPAPGSLQAPVAVAVTVTAQPLSWRARVLGAQGPPAHAA